MRYLIPLIILLTLTAVWAAPGSVTKTITEPRFLAYSTRQDLRFRTLPPGSDATKLDVQRFLNYSAKGRTVTNTVYIRYTSSTGVSTFAGRGGTVIPEAGDYSAFYPSQTAFHNYSAYVSTAYVSTGLLVSHNTATSSHSGHFTAANPHSGSHATTAFNNYSFAQSRRWTGYRNYSSHWSSNTTALTSRFVNYTVAQSRKWSGYRNYSSHWSTNTTALTTRYVNYTAAQSRRWTGYRNFSTHWGRQDSLKTDVTRHQNYSTATQTKLNAKATTGAQGIFSSISTTSLTNRFINVGNSSRYTGSKLKGTIYFDNISGFYRCNGDNSCLKF